MAVDGAVGNAGGVGTLRSRRMGGIGLAIPIACPLPQIHPHPRQCLTIFKKFVLCTSVYLARFFLLENHSIPGVRTNTACTDIICSTVYPYACFPTVESECPF